MKNCREEWYDKDAKVAVTLVDVTDAAQALDFRRPLHTSPLLEEIHAAYRKEVPFIDHDVVMYPHIAKSVEFLRKYPLE